MNRSITNEAEARICPRCGAETRLVVRVAPAGRTSICSSKCDCLSYGGLAMHVHCFCRSGRCRTRWQRWIQNAETRRRDMIGALVSQGWEGDPPLEHFLRD